jgi:hypothetical protein
LDTLRSAIKRGFAEYERMTAKSTNPLIAVNDDAAGRYALVQYGRDSRNKYGSYCVIFAEIKNDKIWIQSDHVEDGFATDLLREGIGQEQIVLGFKDVKLRPHTGFAVE